MAGGHQEFCLSRKGLTCVDQGLNYSFEVAWIRPCQGQILKGNGNLHIGPNENQALI